MVRSLSTVAPGYPPGPFGRPFGWRGADRGVRPAAMTIQTAKQRDPAVRAFVTAVDSHDREGFMTLLAPGATMADDGAEHDLADWVDREIFFSRGHLKVDNESDGGRRLIARHRNDVWGEMRTRWSFVVAEDGRIARLETGQAWRRRAPSSARRQRVACGGRSVSARCVPRVQREAHPHPVPGTAAAPPPSRWFVENRAPSVKFLWRGVEHKGSIGGDGTDGRIPLV